MLFLENIYYKKCQNIEREWCLIVFKQCCVSFFAATSNMSYSHQNNLKCNAPFIFFIVCMQ